MEEETYQEIVEMFTSLLRSTLDTFYQGQVPPEVRDILGVTTLEEMAQVYYDYPSVAKYIPKYRGVIHDVFAHWPEDAEMPFLVAPSAPGQVLLEQTVTSFLNESAEDLEIKYQAIRQDTAIPKSWLEEVSEEPNLRASDLAGIDARAELGGLFVGEDFLYEAAETLHKKLGSRVTQQLDKLVEQGYISYYPPTYHAEALADALTTYQPPNSPWSLIEPGEVSPTVSMLYPEPTLVPLATPPSNPPLNLTPVKPHVTVQEAKRLGSESSQAYNFLNEMKFAQLKELAHSIDAKTFRTKEATINSILNKLPTIPMGRLPPLLQQVSELIAPYQATQHLEEMPIKQLEHLYVEETGQKPIPKQEMVQAIREAESTRVKSRPTSPLTTTETSLLLPWREALQTHPPEEVANALGMVVPPGHNIKKYIQDNLVAYSPVIADPYNQPLTLEQIATNPDPGQLLSHYTDSDLFALMGIYPPYNSRRQLIQRMVTSLSEPIFFMPTELRCANGIEGRTSNNSIAFGTVADYDCFTPQQLIKGYNNGTLTLPNGYRVSPANLIELRELAAANPAYGALFRALE